MRSGENFISSSLRLTFFCISKLDRAFQMSISHIDYLFWCKSLTSLPADLRTRQRWAPPFALICAELVAVPDVPRSPSHHQIQVRISAVRVDNSGTRDLMGGTYPYRVSSSPGRSEKGRYTASTEEQKWR